MKKLVVLISNVTSGTNLQTIIDGIEAEEINAKIVAVISDTQTAIGVKRAKKHKVPVVINKKKENLIKVLRKLMPDYICMAGWKQIIADDVIDIFTGKIVNLHPGAIPDKLNDHCKNPDGTRAIWNRGMMVPVAIRNVLDVGATYAASSIHFLSKEFDFGKVVDRHFEKILREDTYQSLYDRFRLEENKMYKRALQKLCN